jgi:hypothetical protein
MDGKQNNTKGSQSREGNTTQMAGHDLESVIERTKGGRAIAFGLHPKSETRV